MDVATIAEIFPTPVGMVLQHVLMRDCFPYFPHARGDGPPKAINKSVSPAFSPRPWGWSAEPNGYSAHKVIFPTPVGMVRRNSLPFAVNAHFPHARGDGPCGATITIPAALFSPRPWGWSIHWPQHRLRAHIFPTPVGMVRIGEFSTQT